MQMRRGGGGMEEGGGGGGGTPTVLFCEVGWKRDEIYISVHTST